MNIARRQLDLYKRNHEVNLLPHTAARATELGGLAALGAGMVLGETALGCAGVGVVAAGILIDSVANYIQYRREGDTDAQ